jgi:type IV pilus assembly protein PilM
MLISTMSTFSHFLEHYFPVPPFLSMNSAGVDVSDRTIRAMTLKETSQGLRPDRFGIEYIPENIIVSGEVKDVDGLARAIVQLKKKLGFSFARISIPEEHTFVFELPIPRVAEGDLRSAIGLQIEEHVPLAPKDVIFDFDILEKNTEGFQVRVIAAPRDLIMSYIDVCTKAHVTLTALEVEAQALRRAVIPSQDSNTYLLIDYGLLRTGVSIVYRGFTVFTHTIPAGSQSLTEAIAKYFAIPLEEANRIKEKRGLFSNSDDKEFFFTVFSNVSAIREEINRHYIYWHTQSHGHRRADNGDKIMKVFISGGGSNLLGFPEYLATNLRMDIKRANVWTNIFSLDDYIPPLTFHESLSYAGAIGLALGNYVD